MHSWKEYQEIVCSTLFWAEQMTRNMPIGDEQYQAVWNFLHAYGCFGIPTGPNLEFSRGPCFSTGITPPFQRSAVTVIPYFENQTPSSAYFGTPPRVRIGRSFFTDQCIHLYMVERWSATELAATLMHEARHMLHRVGPSLIGYARLDSEEAHETNTRMFTLKMLAAWLGEQWHDIIDKEVTWLKNQKPEPTPPQGIVYVESGIYWPELDHVFAPSTNPLIRRARQELVAIQALMEYWPQRNPSIQPHDVLHTIVATVL